MNNSGIIQARSIKEVNGTIVLESLGALPQEMTVRVLVNMRFVPLVW